MKFGSVIRERYVKFNEQMHMNPLLFFDKREKTNKISKEKIN